MTPAMAVESPVTESADLDRADLAGLLRDEDAALSRLIARWQEPLFRTSYRYLRNTADARDVTAEAFVALYQHRHRLPLNVNVAAWLFTVAANRCRNQLRWRKRHPEESAGADQFRLPDTAASPDDALLSAEAQARFAAAVEQLPHDLKVAVLLHHYEDLAYRDIAQVVGCSERGVETRLYRARLRLRDLVKEPSDRR